MEAEKRREEFNGHGFDQSHPMRVGRLYVSTETRTKNRQIELSITHALRKVNGISLMVGSS